MEILKHQLTDGRHLIWMTAGLECARGEGRTFAEAYWNALDALNEYRDLMTRVEPNPSV